MRKSGLPTHGRRGGFRDSGAGYGSGRFDDIKTPGDLAGRPGDYILYITTLLAGEEFTFRAGRVELEEVGVTGHGRVVEHI